MFFKYLSEKFQISLYNMGVDVHNSNFFIHEGAGQ